jgi:hypothetical protein
MGLYHNVETDSQLRDQIFDSNESPANLMFYSGSRLGALERQRDIRGARSSD